MKWLRTPHLFFPPSFRTFFEAPARDARNKRGARFIRSNDPSFLVTTIVQY
jgi:hypothetical protein